jgi:CheY-like chemotaxis protein
MEKARNHLLLGLSLLQRRRAARASSPVGVHRRVLIVSDDIADGKHLARLLLAKGYERVRVVRKAAKALLLAQTYSPSIVFLDVALTDDAYELASALRRQSGQGSLRVIALTSSIEHSTREQARGAGFERWLVTPVVESELDDLMRIEEPAPS